MKNDVPRQVITKLIENGYEDQIVDIMLECETMTNKVVSDIPLSPTLMAENDTKIMMTNPVYSHYQLLLHKANRDFPVEIPFLLLGNHKMINGEDTIIFEAFQYGFDDETQLKDHSVILSQHQFNEAITRGYEVISLGHTHPNVIRERKEQTLANQLSISIKEQYQIREVGLNISIADIWQQEYWKEQAKTNGFHGEVFQTIIMYNGDMIVIGDKTVSKSNDIWGINDQKEGEKVPTASSDQIGKHL